MVDLKGIKPGKWANGGSFNIGITCESQTPTAVTVTPVKGTPLTAVSTPGRALSFITCDGRDTGEAIVLELMAGGGFVI